MLAPYKEGVAPLRRRSSRRILAAVVPCSVAYGVLFAVSSEHISIILVAPLAALMGLAVWALPNDVFPAPTRILRFLTLSAVFALAVWPNYLAIAPPGMPWITLNRLLGIALLSSLLVCLSVSEAFRTRLRDIFSVSPLLWKALLAFGAIQVFSVIVSVNVPESIDGFITVLVSWAAIYVASSFVFTEPGMAHRWTLVLWATVIVLCLISLEEYREGRVIWAGHIPDLLRIENPDVLRILAGAQREALKQHRVQATFSTSLGLSEYMALALPFIVNFVIGKYSMLTRIAAAATLPVMVFAILFTQSRLGMVGLGVSALMFFFFFGAARLRRNGNDIIGQAIALSYPVLACLFIAASFLVSHIRHVVWGTGATADSTQARFGQWQAGLPKILARPWGYGLGEGASSLNWTIASGLVTIDSYYLTLAMEYGVFGLLLYVWSLAVGITIAIRLIMERGDKDREAGLILPATISLANFVVEKAVFSQPENHPLIYMLFGLITALAYRSKRSAQALPEQRRLDETPLRSARTFGPSSSAQ
jgi:hypothetical protein